MKIATVDAHPPSRARTSALECCAQEFRAVRRRFQMQRRRRDESAKRSLQRLVSAKFLLPLFVAFYVLFNLINLFVLYIKCCVAAWTFSLQRRPIGHKFHKERAQLHVEQKCSFDYNL